MTAASDRLTVAQVATLTGVKPGTWRSYVARGQAPPPDGQMDGRTPFWLRSTVVRWVQQRRGQGWRKPRPIEF